MSDQSQPSPNVEMAIEALDILSMRTTDIIIAFVSNNAVSAVDLPKLITETHRAVMGAMMMMPGETAAPAATDLPTKKQIDASVQRDAIISFIDGKPYKTLKRHLGRHGLTIEQYRQRFGLPRDYPATAASYSEKRSELAKSLGLGQQRRKYPSGDKPALSAVA